MTNFTQSFLIITRDKSLASFKTEIILKENEVNSLDINLQTYEKSMGIEDVRNIQKTALLKPFKGKAKAIVIDAYEDITTEAQNALLKILEEPPANTIIILIASKKELFLPTIISRCKLIILQKKEIKLIQDERSKFEEASNILLNGKIGDKLTIAQDITRNKGDAALWLEKMAVFLKDNLAKNNNLKYLNLLKELQKTYKVIKSTNASARVALENLFLSS